MPRELTLFHVSIISNVSLGEPDVTRLEVERALRQAGAPGFVSQLSDGIDHLVDLSGGQWQHISLARALLYNP